MPNHDVSAFDSPAFGYGHAMRAVHAPSLSPHAERDRHLAFVLFGLLLALNAWALTVGWTHTSLPGNEFRQTQTALTTLFVQRDHDFSLAYPTPVLGKPWSIPMEFPLYQWTVAAVSSATGWPLIETARAVSWACFYLTLPAVWLLLARLHLTPTRRLLALTPLLSCPLYIFYARAFLTETMALMFSLWFLYAFITGVERRRPLWIAVANLTGAAAGLVKVTTFMLYLAPAGAVSLLWLWQERPRARYQFANLTAMARTLGWIAAAVVVPFLLTLAWIQFADATKALNASGRQLVSAAMSGCHFGTWQLRLTAAPWLAHGRTLLTNIAPLASLALLALATALCGARRRRWIIALTLLFLAAPFTFPHLYALHEYYFVANAALLMVAAGLALDGLLAAGRPRWIVWALIAAFHVVQLGGYFEFLYSTQRLPLDGGSGLTQLLRDVTDPDDVLVIAGNDWSSVIPFYAERRALMIRRDFEHAQDYLDRAFAELKNDSVPVVIFVGEQRDNRELIAHLDRALAIDPAPFLLHQDQTVYVSRARRTQFAQRLFNLGYNGVVFANHAESRSSHQPESVAALHTKRVFAAMSPQPQRYQVPYALSLGYLPDGQPAFDAHAPTQLWFAPPPGATHLSAQFGILDPAFTRTGDRTDGVEFAVVERRPDGATRTLFARLLDPVHRPADRQTQSVDLLFSAAPGAEIIFETRAGPAGNTAFDWAYWGKVRLR